jgi:hypothetical protein
MKRSRETDAQFMERVRAYRLYTNIRQDAGLELAAFMELFHPNYPQEKVIEMVIDARAREKTR